MVATIAIRGFGGVQLSAHVQGNPDDPPVLLVHGGGQTHSIWDDVATALVEAGRRVIALDLRGHGKSEWPADERYDFDAFVEDLRAVLAQLEGRPVVIASTMGCWIATVALAGSGATLAAGLVLVDLPIEVDPETTRRFSARMRADHDKLAASNWDIKFLNRFAFGDIAQRLNAAAPSMNLPVLLVRGAQSDFASEEKTADFLALLPDAEFVEVANARLVVRDHWLDSLNALLLEYLERRQSRGPSEYRSGSDPRTLRDALGCFGTGVTVVTAQTEDGTPIGLTANSFTSVSLDPPLLLVCIACNAGSAHAMRSAPHFAVNVLQIGQQPLSNRFAGKGQDRFAANDWVWGEMGSPVLSGSLGTFECDHHAVYEGGDHFILVGHVRKATFDPRRDPLLYFRGKYRRLHFA